MVFPWRLVLSLARYITFKKLQGIKRYPLVLMLEPTFSCNLACVGCGRIREDRVVGNRVLTIEDCLAAVEEAGAPVVSIAGGEPLLHPQIGQIVDAIVRKKRFTHLCTNGIVLERSLSKFTPSPYLCLVLHIDGLAKTHDRIVERTGVFDLAIAGIKAAKQAGFQVRTNTTVYKGTDPEELVEIFSLLSELGVDGMMVAPAFSYEDVNADIFLSREEAPVVFRSVFEKGRHFRFYHSPIYLEFLSGNRSLRCIPWSTPTRNPKGWKTPCYLLNDGYCESFKQLLDETPWDRYGLDKDPRCTNCMVHSGFEASAIDEIGKSLPHPWREARWGSFPDMERSKKQT